MSNTHIHWVLYSYVDVTLSKVIVRTDELSGTVLLDVWTRNTIAKYQKYQNNVIWSDFGVTNSGAWNCDWYTFNVTLFSTYLEFRIKSLPSKFYAIFMLFISTVFIYLSEIFCWGEGPNEWSSNCCDIVTTASSPPYNHPVYICPTFHISSCIIYPDFEPSRLAGYESVLQVRSTAWGVVHDRPMIHIDSLGYSIWMMHLNHW